MKFKKRVLTIIIFVIGIMILFSIVKENRVQAINDIWDISKNQDGSLIAIAQGDEITISGDGEMKDYYVWNDGKQPITCPPWYNERQTIKRLELKNGIASIGDMAFVGLDIVEVSIPNSVEKIGEGAFANCESLKSVTMPSSITTIEKHTFGNCFSLTNITIPSGVITIGESAFGDCHSLTSIIIPSSVTIIGDSAFIWCNNLTDVKILSSKASIEKNAFQMCSNLKNITISEGVTSIGDRAFHQCQNLTSVIIPSSVKSIGNSLFSDCIKLKSVTMPSGIKAIGEYTFYNCQSLTNITIPSSVTIIGNGAFASCQSLTNVTIPSGVTTIGESAFMSCGSLTNIIIPSSIVSIGKSAFSSCYQLKEVTISEGVKNIGAFAFSHCKNLTKVKIPSSVTNMGDDIFFNNNNIVILCYKGTAGEEYAKKYYNYRFCTYEIIPGKVTGVINKTQDTKTITVKWSKVSGTTGYVLEKYDTSKKKYVTVKDLKGTSHKVTGLKAGTTYKFRVRAYVTVGGKKYYGAYSATSSLTTKTATPKISKLTAGSKKATVNWKKVTGATGYEVYMSTKKGSGYKKIKTVTNSKTVKYTKTKLTRKKTYYFKIRTYRTVNGKKVYSSYSSVKSIKVK